MSEVPPWLVDLVAERQRRLRLLDWDICVAVSPEPDGSAGNRASTVCVPVRNYAEVTFRDDLPDDPEAVQTVDHELLHIAHARIDQHVREVLIPRIPKAARGLAYDTYRALVMEPFIDSLATALTTDPPPPATKPRNG